MRVVILVAALALSGFAAVESLSAAPADSGSVLFEADSFSTVEAALRDGWEMWSQREEIRPSFFISAAPGPGARGSLGLSCGSNSHARGGWRHVTGGVSPGSFYRLEASWLARGMNWPRQKVLARLAWLRADSSLIPVPEYVSRETGRDGEWHRVDGVFRAPEGACMVRVELYLGHAEQGEAFWDRIRLSRAPVPAGRPVRLAAVYHRPRDKKSSAESVEEFCVFLDEAGRQGCDIVCLGETVNRIGLAGVSFPDVAEPIPGPTTRRLGETARRHGMYVVAGLAERSGAAVYSSAVLIGRDGEVAGVYRRVYLSEVHFDQGVSAGDTYPVFDTDFGRIGIMTGYDSWSPDPARELAAQGAEIIFLPVWGDNETVIRARALENSVFIVLAGYDSRSKIFNPWGESLAEPDTSTGLDVADIDLDFPPPCPFAWPQPDMQLRMLHERRLDIPPVMPPR